MAYKQIHETFWTDPQVKKYRPLQRYLFSYFITGPHAHYSGLYYLPMIYTQNETGLSMEEITEGVGFLTEKGHILYDHDREVIFVKSEMMYQLDNKKDGKVLLNEKHIKGLKKHFDTLHRSPLIGTFLETYPYLEIEYTAICRGTDTRINTGMDRDSVLVPVLVSVQEEGAGGNERTDPGPASPYCARNKIPPKLEDVVAYCKERNNGVNPNAWFDHYSANGWKVGKAASPMRDWQAAIRTWENNNQGGSSDGKGNRERTRKGAASRRFEGTSGYPVDLREEL